MDDKLKALINLANDEVGYLEKKNKNNLDDKIKNYGYNNFTKYARDLDAINNFYNGKKQGSPWCSVFVAWLFVKTYGVDKTRILLNYPVKSLASSCTYAINYFKKVKSFVRSPKIGDIIFFKQGHTGLVVNVDKNYVYTIEGNTTNKNGVYANGGGVYDKSYRLNNESILGYGRPLYEKINENPKNDDEKNKNNVIFGFKMGKCNAYYKTLKSKAIRRTPTLTDNIKKVGEISASLRKGLIYKNKNNLAKLKVGCTLTALEFLQDKNGLIWLKNYDGYIVACETTGEAQVKFVKDKN